MERLVWWNGRFIKEYEAKLSIYDFKRLGDLFLAAMVQETKNEIGKAGNEND